MKSVIAQFLTKLGRTRGIGNLARRILRRYPDGSVTTIKSGVARGMRWRRFHRFSNGYWLGHYEVDTQQCLSAHVKAGDRVYDIGANAGFFVAVCSRLTGPTGSVVAVEPFPEFAERVRDLIHLNQLSHVTVVEAAVSNDEGKATFTADLGSKQKLDSRNSPTGKGVEVVQTTLDRLADEYGEPDLLLIDIEGQEANAVAGGVATLRRAHPTLIIETHFHKDDRGVQIARRLRELLVPIGYRFFNMDGHPVGEMTTGATELLPHRLIALHPARESRG